MTKVRTRITTDGITNSSVTYGKIQDVSATDKLLGRSTAGAGVIEEVTCTSFARTILDDADAATARATLGVTIGTNVQAYDAELAALAVVTSAADALPYFTGAGAATTTTLTSFGRTLIDDADAATARATLGVTIGTNVQAYDAELAALASVTSAANALPYFTGSGTATTTTLSSFGRSLIDNADAATARTTLSVQPTASPAFTGAATFDNTGNVVPLTVTNTGTANSFVVNDASGDTTPFVIDASGSVGILKSSPQATLDIGSGNLLFSSTAQRITGDFSNATISNRLMFQSSTSNGNTSVRAVPNGTATTANFAAHNGADASNTSFIAIQANATETIVNSGSVGTGTNLPLTFYTGGAAQVQITTSGVVLIGLSASVAGTAQFQIAAASNTEMAIVRTAAPASTNSIAGITCTAYDGSAYVAGGTINFRAAENWSSTNHGTDIQFRTTPTGSGGALAEAMRITGGGNVGIGTSSPDPSTKLNVAGAYPSSGTVTRAIMCNGTVPSGSTVFGDGIVSFLATAAASFTCANLRHFVATQATLGAGSSVTNQYGYVVESTLTGATNNYGFYSNIGSGAGRYNFYAAGTAENYFAGVVTLGGGSASAPILTSSVGTSDTGLWFPAADVVAVSTAGVERVRVDASGNVRVGNTNADVTVTGERFSVLGGAFGVKTSATTPVGVWNTNTSGTRQYIYFYVNTGTLTGTINTDGTTTAYNTTSDYRLKTVSGGILDATPRLESLRPCEYVWNSTGQHGEGFLAHELAQSVPHAVTGEKDAVTEAGAIDPQQVDLSKIVPLLVAALQESNARIAALEERLNHA